MGATLIIASAIAVFFQALIITAFPASVSGEALENYGDPVDVEILADEEAGLKSLAQVVKSRDGNSLMLDKNLVMVAREMASEVQQDGSRQKEVLSSRHISGLLQKYGIYEISVRSQILAYGTGDDLRAMIPFHFETTRDHYTHMGVGVAPPDGQGRSGVALLLLSDKRVRLSPFPRKVNLPSSWTLHGKLVYSSQGHEPKILLTPPSGRVEVISAGVSGDTFSASIPFNQGPGTYRIEVVSRGSGESQVAALLEVTAGFAVDSGSATFEISGFEEAAVDEEEAERMVLEMLNQVRENEGLPPFSEDFRLKEMAKAHSRDMKKNRFVGHASPERGALKDRIRQAGLEGFGVKENVALDISLVHAMNNLLKSPVHRGPIIEPEINSVGVGIVFDDSSGTRHYYLTQEFARVY
jgi:uncharacterized protein YkwD